MAKKIEALSPVSNDAAPDVAHEEPYTVHVRFVGTSAILFHRWSVEAIAEKASARKGSAAKKTDNLESYVYRTEAGELAIPGEYLRQSIISAAKFRQDPRSPRKSAMDLFKAGIAVGTELCSVGKTNWDFLDQRRVMVQRNGITRVRPAMLAGWGAECDLLVLLPEYIGEDLLSDVLTSAGRLIGVGDFRPTYGRFRVASFERLK